MGDVAVVTVEPRLKPPRPEGDVSRMQPGAGVERVVSDIRMGIRACNDLQTYLRECMRLRLASLPNTLTTGLVQADLRRVASICDTHGVDVQVTMRDERLNGYVMPLCARLIYVLCGGLLTDGPEKYRLGAAHIHERLIRVDAILQVLECLRLGLQRRLFAVCAAGLPDDFDQNFRANGE